MSRQSRPPGFTLIELLVVISIIALLIAVLLPALKAARENAQSIACSSNLRQIGIANHAYITDNRGWFPPQIESGPSPTYSWYTLLQEYMAGYKGGEHDKLKVYQCPSAKLPDGAHHYAAHHKLFRGSGAATAQKYRIEFAKRTSIVFTFADSQQVPGLTNKSYGTLSAIHNGSLADANSTAWYYNPAASPPQYGRACRYTATINNRDVSHVFGGEFRWRHNNESTTNLAFIDGHVESKRINPQDTDRLDGTIQLQNILVDRP